MIKVRISSTIFNSKVIALPNKLFSSVSTLPRFEALVDFDGVRYPVTVSSNTEPIHIPGEPLYYKGYRMIIGEDLRNKISSTFAYSYMMNLGKQLNRNSDFESMNLEGKIENGVPIFTVVDRTVHEENELMPIIREYIISKQFDIPKVNPKSRSSKGILQHFSKTHIIADYKKHAHAKKAIYWWLDMDKNKLYIGSTNNLVERFKDHTRNTGDSMICSMKYGSDFNITHFGYWKFRDIVPMKLLLAFELFAIKLVATLIPNRSSLSPKGPTVIPFITDTSWELVNNKYN